jgi:glycosyltransferase involved in cell wall biosynthesis
MIEAMACGTPVVAWRCGAVPEVVDDGLSGFIVASSKVMARNYLALYWSLAHGGDPDLKLAAVG